MQELPFHLHIIQVHETDCGSRCIIEQTILIQLTKECICLHDISLNERQRNLDTNLHMTKRDFA